MPVFCSVRKDGKLVALPALCAGLLFSISSCRATHTGISKHHLLGLLYLRFITLSKVPHCADHCPLPCLLQYYGANQRKEPQSHVLADQEQEKAERQRNQERIADYECRCDFQSNHLPCQFHHPVGKAPFIVIPGKHFCRFPDCDCGKPVHY